MGLPPTCGSCVEFYQRSHAGYAARASGTHAEGCSCNALKGLRESEGIRITWNPSPRSALDNVCGLVGDDGRGSHEDILGSQLLCVCLLLLFFAESCYTCS
jgi:hypothetical protein